MKSLIVTLITCLLIFISGCESKSCKNTLCGVNQVCNNGACYCLDGYEGSACNQLSATKFITKSGTSSYYQWTVSENCQNGGGGSTYYTSFQSTGSNISELVFNFLGTYQITAYIRGATDGSGNTIEIPTQQLGGSGTIYGLGTYNTVNKQITINFEYTLNGQNKACVHNFY